MVDFEGVLTTEEAPKRRNFWCLGIALSLCSNSLDVDWLVKMSVFNAIWASSIGANSFSHARILGVCFYNSLGVDFQNIMPCTMSSHVE